jgi:hypothetical protein
MLSINVSIYVNNKYRATKIVKEEGHYLNAIVIMRPRSWLAGVLSVDVVSFTLLYNYEN